MTMLTTKVQEAAATKRRRFTHSNDDCSEHLFTGVKEGSLIRLKVEMEYFNLGTDKIKNWQMMSKIYTANPRFVDSPKEDVFLIFLGQERLVDLPGAVNGDLISIFAWSFTFFHKDMGKLTFVWDMALSHELDADAYFEVIKTK